MSLNKKKFSLLGLISIITFVGACDVSQRFFTKNKGFRDMPVQIQTKEDLIALFPRDPQEMVARVNKAVHELKEGINAIIAIPGHERTFDNTMRTFDQLCANSAFSIMAHITQMLEMVSPDEAMRNTAHEQLIKLQEIGIDLVNNNRDLYQALKAYAQGNALHEQLTPEQRYFVQETMDDYKRRGLDLPTDKQEKVKELNKQLAVLTTTFDANIAKDNRTIAVKKEALEGVYEAFIANLKRNEQGDIVVGVDYPTYIAVMENCSVADTRKQLFTAYAQRAYPVNEQLMKDIIAKRDELAQVLGFESYTHLELDAQMVKVPARAQKFLDNVWQKATIKEGQEYAKLVKDLPASVTLTAEGKFNPWDMAYTLNQYKKHHLAINEALIAEYFPMESTVQGLLGIYEQFLGINFKQVPLKGLWHEDVQLIAAHTKGDDTLLGYLVLDLHPRPFKYGHACQDTIIPALVDAEGNTNTAVLMVIANFPKATATQPSLLKRNDVNTFFHEFGHAMHALLGRTELASQAGTSVKLDFVEMPSQMLEEWLWDKGILKMLSKHYQTGESLSDDMIAAILKLKNFDTGIAIQRQANLAHISLAYFMPGVDKDPYTLLSQLNTKLRPHVQFAPQDRMYASFGHLTGYGARYYGYLWSKVFALDMFDFIKQQNGLLSPEIGQRYVTKVIGRGGSVDPNILVQDFLGREPNDKAFFADLGL